jgi:DNA-directed RNA polymerase II subunit RPB1
MPFYKELEYGNIDKVIGVQFGLMSPQEIRARSVTEITETQTYQGTEPHPKGLFDARMGVLDYDKICPTDGYDSTFCPGYFGHIELARPVFYYQYIQTVKLVLNCTCFKCGKLLASWNDTDVMKIVKKYPKGGERRFTDIVALCSKINVCGDRNEDGCGKRQPDKYLVEIPGKITGVWNANNRDANSKQQQFVFTAKRVQSIFKRMSDDDIETLGLSKKLCRPEWMICECLAVPPPAVRPSVKQDNNQRMEDDLTSILIDILKANTMVKNKIDALGALDINMDADPNSKESKEVSDKKANIDRYTSLLQYHVTVLIDNGIPHLSPATQRSGRPLKAIKQRLISKEGRIRGNLMGKRVDFSARSVITPDPNIKVNQLGVPKTIAMNLTYPEQVSKYNIDKLQKLVNNGPNKYPGAKTIKTKTRAITIEYVKGEIKLEYGDIVNRHLLDGDFVLFNRQPSLHRMSMMAHRIKVVEYSTFRLNVSVTSPYNADFDGDEMNMHVPQSIQSSNELRQLVDVTYQIIGPKQNKPLISIVQDTLLGVYRLTRQGHLFNAKEFMNIMMKNNNFNGHTLLNKQNYTGHDIMTSVLPPINMHMGNDNYDDEDKNSQLNFVKIDGGIVKQGIFDKGIFGKVSRGLIHSIHNDFGAIKARDFIDNVQTIIVKYLLYTGFSVGICDIMPDKKTKDKIQEIIKEQKLEAEKIIQEIHLNVFENDTGLSNKEVFEGRMSQTLATAGDTVYKIAKKNIDPKNNRMLCMHNAGSKGSSQNISQMTSCLGQQLVDGKRIVNGFTDRTLPHFHKYDDSPEARGFVSNSFVDGLTAQEFYMHAMGGREGLIDTAVKTSQTGYIQRQLVKAMEDAKVIYDNSVRTASGCIVQFSYGEDNMDAMKVESQNLRICEISNDTFNERFNFNKNENWDLFLEQSIVDSIQNDTQFFKKYNKYVKNLLELRTIYIRDVKKCYAKDLDMVQFPVHIERKITLLLSIPMKQRLVKSDLSPLEIIEGIDYILEQTKNKSIIFEMLLKVHFSPVYLLKYNRINRQTFENLKMNIINCYENSQIEAGEMVGAVAAQSLGETSTQMTLNTFHTAGAGSGITTGVPRLKEIMHITSNLKTPSLTIFLKDDVKYDIEKSKDVMNKLEITKLKDLVTGSSIFYEPDDFNTTIDDDKDFMEIYKEFNEFDDKCKSLQSNKSDWMLRFEFDRKLLLNKSISMEEIYEAINKLKSARDTTCMFSDNNASKLIFRIRLNNTDENADDISILRTLEKDLLEKTIIRGVNKITKVTFKSTNDWGEINEQGEFEAKKQWILNTIGVNLLDVLIFPNIDPYKTTCNDIWEIYHTLGIEAARNALQQQFIKTLEDSKAGEINIRHIYLLVDTMTHRGSLMPINRHGINRVDTGPLAKCSFEETTDQLLKASIFGKTDNVDGVSANIMLGQTPPCGTGLTDVLMDEVKLNELFANGDVKFDTIDESDDEDSDDEDDGCDLDDLQHDFNPNLTMNGNINTNFINPSEL